MLSPSDLRNPSRKSGYIQVGGPKHGPDGYKAPKPFQAQGKRLAHGGPGGRSTYEWMGPRRVTALEAAQDYCDYINSGRGVAPDRVRSAGNHVARDPIDDQEVQAALGVLRDARAQRRKLAQGYVYCIGEEGRWWYAVKVGYSVKPSARVAELQTGNPRKLVLLGAIQGTEEDEAAMHQRYMKQNLLLEWFRPSLELLSEFGINLPAVWGDFTSEGSTV